MSRDQTVHEAVPGGAAAPGATTRGRRRRRLRLAAALVAAALWAAPAAGQGPYPRGSGAAPGGCDPAVAQSAEAAFRQVLDLWKDERYGALWELGYLEQRTVLPEDDFVRLMRREDRKLQCCWLTARNVQVLCDGADAYVTATIGYEVGGYQFDPAKRVWAFDRAPRDVNEVWRLRWQAGAWRVDLYQVLGPALLYYEKLPGTTFGFDFPRFPQIDPRVAPAPGRSGQGALPGAPPRTAPGRPPR